MKKPRVHETLRQLAGHLELDTDDQRRNFDLLCRTLPESNLPGHTHRASYGDFSIAKADLFFDETIPKERLDVLDKVARTIEEWNEEPRALVFVRDVPIREPLLHASVPAWAAGALVSQSGSQAGFSDAARQ